MRTDPKTQIYSNSRNSRKFSHGSSWTQHMCDILHIGEWQLVDYSILYKFKLGTEVHVFARPQFSQNRHLYNMEHFVTSDKHVLIPLLRVFTQATEVYLLQHRAALKTHSPLTADWSYRLKCVQQQFSAWCDSAHFTLYVFCFTDL